MASINARYDPDNIFNQIQNIWPVTDPQAYKRLAKRYKGRMGKSDVKKGLTRFSRVI
ncbi:hypothetical protein [Ktedonobacter sp. SOSP1-85]|uniref:hypothetical protein n=1 Tax=Ktedonobacter sp. SOSP1-85 TaxID=2778367 RepID=UPI001915B665